MDFFASQELARRKSKWLIFYLIVAVISMIAAVYLLVMVAFGIAGGSERDGVASSAAQLFNPIVLGAVSFAVISIVGSGSLYKVAALRGGGENVALTLGGRRIPPNSIDPIDRRILNVVEEMALAAGTPVPPVYVMDQEPGINAFAAGYTIDDAVIAVNRGTVEQLSRDELQGVVAHEFSHILNGDMRMSIRIIGVLHGIQLLALIGYFTLRSMSYSGRSSSRKDGGSTAAILAIAVGLIVIGSLGMFFARLIKASVSRQREYLADASAVQFTRNPDGISGALKMIGGTIDGSVMQNPNAEQASHMYFSSMFQRQWLHVFATHPPLEKRVRAIEPNFDGDFNAYAAARIERRRRREAARQQREEEQKRAKFELPGMGGRGGLPGMMSDQFPVDPLILIAGIGLPDNEDVEYSEMIVDQIPVELANAARDVYSARCLVFASLLNRERDMRKSQLHALAENEDQATIDETIRLMPHVDALQPRYRLPIFEILQGSLTGMSPEQFDQFRGGVDRLIKADNRVDLFEFFLRHHLMVHLDRKFGKIKPPQVRYRALGPLQNEICRLLALMVDIGQTDEQARRSAFAAAIESIGKPWQKPADGSGKDFVHESLVAALENLNAASPIIKKRVLTATAIAMTHDKIVTVEEAELFRAMSESLDCPVPPVVASINREN